MTTRIFLAMSVVCGLTSVSLGQSRTRDGVAVGGLTGAVIGGIIGHQNDETPEGALIGGAVGAIAGGLLGRSQDNELARQRQYQQQAYYQQQQQAYAQQQAVVQSGVSINDVVNMSRSGVSETLIMSQLQSRGVQRRLEVSEIISLHQQGVSDTVISAVQAAPLATQLAAPRYAPSQPMVVREPQVIVQEPVIYRSPVVVHEYYRPYPVYHYPSHHHHYHSGASLRVGF